MQKLTNFSREDVLTDVLGSLHIQGTLYCRSKMSAPWGFCVPQRETATFHVVTSGQCWLDVDGVVKDISLHSGDLVILPHGHAHGIRNPQKSPVTQIEYLDDLVKKLSPDKQG